MRDKEQTLGTTLPDSPTVKPVSKLAQADAAMVTWLNLLFNRYLYMLVLTLAVAYLAFSWYTTQLKYAELQAYQAEGSFALSRTDTALRFQRDNFANRPLITTYAGDSLLELNDLGSTITVNGQTNTLWEAYHGYTVDAQNSRFFHSISRDGWTLFKELTLLPESNHLLIEYYFRNDVKRSDVSLQVAHYRYHYLSTQLNEDGFEAILGRSIGLPEIDQQKYPRYKLNLKINIDQLKKDKSSFKLEEGYKNQYGLISINVNYDLNDIPINERTLIASETIDWEETVPFQK